MRLCAGETGYAQYARGVLCARTSGNEVPELVCFPLHSYPILTSVYLLLDLFCAA